MVTVKRDEKRHKVNRTELPYGTFKVEQELNNTLPNYSRIQTGLNQLNQLNVIVVPFVFQGRIHSRNSQFKKVELTEFSLLVLYCGLHNTAGCRNNTICCYPIDARC